MYYKKVEGMKEILKPYWINIFLENKYSKKITTYLMNVSQVEDRSDIWMIRKIWKKIKAKMESKY